MKPLKCVCSKLNIFCCGVQDRDCCFNQLVCIFIELKFTFSVRTQGEWFVILISCGNHRSALFLFVQISELLINRRSLLDIKEATNVC